MSHDVTSPPSAKAIFNAALEVADPAERCREVDRLCGSDDALRQKVQRLLAAHEAAAASPLDKIVRDFGPNPTVIPAAAGMAEFDLSLHPQIGPYTLLEQIGEGGMGSVYVAEQIEPVRRRVALKIVKPGMDTRDVLARFEAERQALAMMNHPHIAKILDGGATETGRPYFVMELVKGIPITDYCDRHALTVRQRLELFILVCQAVQHAHQKGIIHRDLKPSNVLVELHDVKPVPKVIDFGIAKATSQALSNHRVYTQYAQLIGTPLYMSPEQAQLSGLDVDTRSDVYSLGVLLYELLTGTTPFDQATLTKDGLEEMRRIIREVEPPRPSHKVSTLHAGRLSTVSAQRQVDARKLSVTMQRELDWVVMKALEKDRDRRYESASALAADLQRYLADEPVLACPPSFAYRLRKSLRRKRGLIATTAMVALSLVIGSAVAIWQAVVANQERNRANQTAERVIEESRRAEIHARSADEKARLADAQRLRAETAELEQRRQTARAEDVLYASAIRLAYRQKQAGDDEQAQQLLDSWLPRPGGADRRGLEWRLLRQQLQVPGEELLRLPGDISCTRISPDGAYVVAATDGGAIQRYSFSARRPLAGWETGLADVRRMEFSPDGKYLAAISYEAEAVLVDTSTGQVRLRCPPPVTATKNPDVCFVDGRLLTTGNGGLVSIWNLESMTLERAWDTGNDLVLDLATSPGAAGLFLLSHNHEAEVRYQARHIPQLNDGVTAGRMLLWFAPSTLAISPDGRVFALGSNTGDVLLWDRLQGEFVARWKLAEKINEIVFSPDGASLAAAERTGVVHVWNWRQASQSPAMNLSGHHRHWQAHDRPARSVTFTSDSRQVVTGGFDGRVVRWACERPHTRSIPTDEACRQLLILHGARAVAALDRTALRLFDLQSGQLLAEQPYADREPSGRYIACDDSGRWLAFADRTGPIRCGNLQLGYSLSALPDAEVDDTLHQLAFLPGTQTLLAVDLRPALRVRGWDVEQRQLRFDRRFDGIIPKRVTPARRNGEFLALTEDAVIRFDPVSGEIRGRWPCMGSNISCAAATADGTLLAIGHSDRIVTLVDALTGQVRQTLLGHLGELHRLEFSSDGQTLLAHDDRGDFRLWHVASGSELLQWPSASAMTGFDLSADGRSLAIARERELELLDIDNDSAPVDQSTSDR